MLTKNKKIHFIGIGGIGMSGIAELLYSLDFVITGSDLINSDRTNYLSELGIDIKIGHYAENIQLYIAMKEQKKLFQSNKKFFDIFYDRKHICNKELQKMWLKNKNLFRKYK